MKTYPYSLVVLGAVAAMMGACSSGSSGGPEDSGTPPAAANTAPKISGLPATEGIGQDSSSAPIAFQISDAESPASALNVTVASSDPALISPQAVQLAGNAGARELLITPVGGATGTSTLTISATDSARVSTTQTIDVTVTGEQRSLREMIGTAYGKSPEAQAEETAGYAWVDNPQEETAFDHLFVME